MKSNHALPETTDYFKFFISLMGYSIYHRGQKLYKNEAWTMVQDNPEIYDHIRKQEFGFLLVPKPGWQNGVIVNYKLA